MTRPASDLMFHPVRIRILVLLNQHGTATTAQLAEWLPNVTRRTLYRHLNELLEGGLIRVAKRERIRGTVERSYEPARPALLDAGEMRDLAPEDWQKFFIFMTSLLQAEFSAFVEERYGPAGLSGSHVRLGEIRVTPEQMEAFIAETSARSKALETSEPEDAERETYRIGLIAFPLPESMP